MFDMMNGGGPGMDYETMARMAQQQQPMVMPPQQQMMPGGGPGAASGRGTRFDVGTESNC